MPINETPYDKLIFTGTHNQYRWLTSTEQYIGTLVKLCPDILLNRHLVVTTIDSGSPWLTGPQCEKGWRLRNGMACSPPISGIEELFYQRDGLDTPGYDEWYAFDAPPGELGEILVGNPFLEENSPKPGRLLVFVGWGAFVLQHYSSDPAVRTIVDMFWQQMDWIQPDIYISDGRENLTVICSDQKLFDSVHARLGAAMTT